MESIVPPSLMVFTRSAIIKGIMQSRITSRTTKNGVIIAGFLYSLMLFANIFNISDDFLSFFD